MTGPEPFVPSEPLYWPWGCDTVMKAVLLAQAMGRLELPLDPAWECDEARATLRLLTDVGRATFYLGRFNRIEPAAPLIVIFAGEGGSRLSIPVEVSPEEVGLA